MNTLARFFKLKEETVLLISVFALLYAIYCLEQIYFIYGNVLESYGLSSQTTGNILGAFFGAIMLTRPIGGWMTENLGIKRAMMASAIIAFAGCSMLFFERGVLMLYAGRVISGIGVGIFSIGLFSYQALRIPAESRGKAFAITSIGGILPMGTITPAAEWLVNGGHIKTYLSLGPIIAVICFFMSGIIKDEKPKESSGRKSWGTYGDLLRNRAFIMLCLTCGVMSLVDAASASISLMALERGLVASSFIASVSFAAVFTRLCGSRILNAIPHSFSIAPFAMLMSIALLGASLSKSNFSFLLCGILFGVGIGGGFPMMLASISDILPEELRPKGTTATFLIYDLGWFVTPVLIGALAPILGLPRSFTALACAMLAALVILTLAYWAPKKIAEKKSLKP